MKNSRIFVYVMEKKELKINADKTSWYVLYTAPRAEKQVRDRINALGVECWLPLHRAPRVWSDRVKIVELPLFNSYLFVRCTDPELRNLTRVYGVARIVYYNGKPAVVRQKEIDAIQRRTIRQVGEFSQETCRYGLYLSATGLTIVNYFNRSTLATSSSLTQTVAPNCSR